MLRRTVTVACVVLFSSCGIRPRTFDDAYVPRRVAVVQAPTAVVQPRGEQMAAARRQAERELWMHALIDYLESVFEKAHPAPPPVSAHRCEGLIGYEIQSVFGWAAEWFSSIVWRESRCDPYARNPSGSAGLAQLNGHADLLVAACPGADPALSWADADCNVRAAWALFLDQGARPWAL